MPSELTREDAERLGQSVNSIVRQYIDAQNSIFKFSFARALGLKRSDPAAAAARTEKLRAEVSNLLGDVRELKLDAGDPLGTFYMTLRPYLRGLDEAMEYFIGFCGRMAAAQREKRSRYWGQQYKDELLEFQEKERAYLAIGAELNERWGKLKRSADSKRQ